jgi:hypothetical protein
MANNDNYLSFFSSFWVPLFWKGKDSKKKPGHGSSSVQLFGVVNSGYMMYIQVTKLDMYINIYIHLSLSSYIYTVHIYTTDSRNSGTSHKARFPFSNFRIEKLQAPEQGLF